MFIILPETLQSTQTFQDCTPQLAMAQTCNIHRKHANYTKSHKYCAHPHPEPQQHPERHVLNQQRFIKSPSIAENAKFSQEYTQPSPSVNDVLYSKTMALPSENSERNARRAFVRDRQRMVFTFVIGFLSITVLISLLLVFNVFGTGISKNTIQNNFGFVAPCLEKTANTAHTNSSITNDDGKQNGHPNDADKEITEVSPNTIKIRVLNGTRKTGLAKAVTDSLQLRGYQMEPPSDYPEKVDRTEIRFGKNSIQQAYTVLNNFTDAKLVMDDRTDKLIDVVIGKSFGNLKSSSQVKDSTSRTLVSLKNCKPASEMKELPKSIPHDQV